MRMKEMKAMWENPSMLVKTNKDILKSKRESMIQRLGEYSLPINEMVKKDLRAKKR
ncbi:MAG: hypothetical protein ACD_37C00483G0002 [uncultured bacterium]|nr:MAG: hypothetical protein ACD_37C00483G0002 [uncultured bacterium]KKQ37274.1 MAG: hypothetical protein US55_C0036G0009 [Candidatus Levybacteria bacterium GW2011_GWC2_37_7]KKQ40872.1 MAG: hypothetical protein US59_C0045G0007 [Candidatus Levybacteria bacterium GW2011_GWB1_37_8]